MKPKASINLPQWVPVVWIAALLSLFSFFLETRDVEWSGYVSLSGTIIEAILWVFIMASLHRRGNAQPILMVFISLSLVLDIVSEISALFVEEISVGLISLIVWSIALIIIVVNYSGAFRKYAIVNLVCIGAIILYSIIPGFLDIDFSNLSASTFRWIIYPMLALVYYSYQVLVEAISENEEDSDSIVSGEENNSQG